METKMDPALLAAEKVHNIYRRKHGASPLRLDDKLNAEAVKVAKLILNGHNKSVPPATQNNNNNVGRNEYESIEEEEEGSREAVAKAAVSEWYSNHEHYNWDSPPMSHHKALLFCQVVWKNSSHLGFGIVSKGPKFVVVALYSPGAGNSADEHQHRDNVQKAIW